MAEMVRTREKRDVKENGGGGRKWMPRPDVDSARGQSAAASD